MKLACASTILSALLSSSSSQVYAHSGKESSSSSVSKKSSQKGPKGAKGGARMCGLGTEFDEILEQCVIQGLSIGMDTAVSSKCAAIEGGAECYCDSYGYGTRGPKLVPHSSCQKYVSCFEAADGSHEGKIMQCEPGYAYDVVAQVCYFKGDVDCFSRDSDNLSEVVPSQCLSGLNPDEPICGCET